MGRWGKTNRSNRIDMKRRIMNYDYRDWRLKRRSGERTIEQNPWNDLTGYEDNGRRNRIKRMLQSWSEG